ncbi:sensor histidine kinase [Flavobacterium maritimum]|uniref:sensor histidine kinase n=1 Tax=Flavobacterium maritimum TaxID=3149042 RepID=UPI0032B553B2
MKKCFFVMLLVSFQVFFSSVSAQLKPSNFTFYPDLEGAGVNDVITDKMGNVWLATDNGLVRYDGYEYKRFYPDPNDPKTMGSILTFCLYEDYNGHIWIGCVDMLSEYNPYTKSFKNYNFSKVIGLPFGSQPLITTINADNEGRMYFGVTSGIGIIGSHAIFYKDKNSKELKRLEAPSKIDIKNVYVATTDKLGAIWIIADNGFFRIDSNKNIHKEKWPIGKFESKEQYYKTIKSDKSGNIWLTSINGILSVWNPSSGKLKSYPMKQLFTKLNGEFITNEMEIDSKGNIWLGTNNGLIYFDRTKEQFEILKENPDQKTARANIGCLHLDSFDNLWLGTKSQGLIRYFNRTVLKSFVYKQGDKNSITNGWVTKMFENKEGKIWIVTARGINVFDPNNNSLIPYPFSQIMPGLDWHEAAGLYSPEEILIRENNQFFFLFNTTNKTFKKIKPDPRLSKAYIYKLFNDSKGNLWYCTSDGAFLTTKNNETLRHFDLLKISGSNATSNEVVNMYESPKHGLWFLTNNGLFLYNYGTDKVERHGFDKKKGDILRSQDINSLYEDEDGIVWVGAWGGGLNRYNIETKKIKTYTTGDGLPSMSIQGILPDEKNKAIWLSTFEGISRFSIKEELFNNFSIEDGIQGLLFADGSYLKTSGGQLIFGGNNGITVFNPDDIAKNSSPPKVFITDFKIGELSIYSNLDVLKKKESNKAKNIVLNFDQNNIAIDYIGIHYANPTKNKFAYRLENYDDNWREVGNIRTAYYYNLPPGDYVFHLKVANSSGVWNESGSSVAFSITPPWWLTWWAYTLYGIIFIVLVLLIDRFQRKRLLEKEHVLAKEKELAHAREIEKAFNTLKTTQIQLIQSEKMASLGELTAGIAHEIQNPLNFVNNFSGVSLELIDEMQEEMDKGDTSEANAIAADIKQNLEKIIFHGKRADGIVKGMLQHSRISSGQKELTDINALADEYLRLAYHGLRAKDKSFNAELETHFDPKLPKVDIISQDIGRVLLNLFTNAFYATHQKQKTANQDYKPVLCVTTAQKGNFIEIIVKDNGTGIPNAIRDKIMQPFFTTKPTGEGTGLGLSLSYDIVVKGHGGTINVETEEGNGATFIISLPI